MSDRHLLAVRALNHLRKLHLPTYVAARFMVDSVAGTADSSWSDRVPFRMYATRIRPRFHIAKRFKKISDRALVYRSFHVPSPTTALAEAAILRTLSRIPELHKPPCVYSYRWPDEPSYPHSFENYTIGYRERNEAIARHLRAHPHRVVLVTDIENFYPSIRTDDAKKRFDARLSNAKLAADELEAILRMVDHVSSATSPSMGLAVGPEISHVLADIALETIDEVMQRKYSGRYFRYVDDIILLLDPKEEEEALDLIVSLLAAEGLTAHPDKTDILPASDWLQYGPQNFHAIESDSFEALKFSVKAYLLLHPEEESNLERAFRELQIKIPLKHLAALTKGHFASKFLRLRRRGWWVALRSLSVTQADLIAQAISVRDSVSRELKRMLHAHLPPGSTRQRWHTQRLRYLINRALYLMPFDELREMRGALGRYPEFVETSALLQLILDGDPVPLLGMPGPAVAAAATMIRDLGLPRPSLTGKPLQNPDMAESLAILELYGVAETPPEIVNTYDEFRRGLLDFCAGRAPDIRERATLDYLDELRTLQIGRKPADITAVLDTRFSEDEDDWLDALAIGGNRTS